MADAAIDSHREAAELYESFGLTDDCARLHFNLANSCCEFSDLTGADRWQETVLHYEQSLRVRTRLADPERYTATLENLGTAYRRLPAADGSNLKNSIKCCRQAMHIYAAAAYPDKNASLLGIDARLITRSAQRALHHFDRSLRIQSTDRSSRAYGITQYNRAQACLRLARNSPAAWFWAGGE